MLLRGIVGASREAARRPRTLVVTVEEVVDELDAPMNAFVIPGWQVAAISEVPGGAYPSYALGYYAARQRVLPRVGRRSRATATRFTAWMQRARARHRRPRGLPAQRGSGRVTYTPDEMMTVAAARRLQGRRRLLRRHRAAERGVQPRAAHARAEPRADLRVGHRRHAPDGAAALDRRRRARRDGAHGDPAAGDLHALPAARARGRRIPRRGADRPVRRPQQHRDRPVRRAEGAAPRLGRRAGDRRRTRARC